MYFHFRQVFHKLKRDVDTDQDDVQNGFSYQELADWDAKAEENKRFKTVNSVILLTKH